MPVTGQRLISRPNRKVGINFILSVSSPTEQPQLKVRLEGSGEAEAEGKAVCNQVSR